MPLNTQASSSEPTHLHSAFLQQSHAPSLHGSSPTLPLNSHVVTNSATEPMPQDTSVLPTTPSHPTSAVEVTSSPLPNLACPSSSLDRPSCICTSSVTVAPAAPTHHIVTRSQTGNLTPKSFSDFKLFRAVKHPLLAYHTLALPLGPSTYRQAATSPKWVDPLNSMLC